MIYLDNAATTKPSDGVVAKALQYMTNDFGNAGSIYSFGYTLLIGVILNMVMGVFFSRVMLRSISKWKIFRSPFFYGCDK